MRRNERPIGLILSVTTNSAEDGRVRRFNPRRVKIHRNYTVEEVARLFGVHKNTVRDWLKVRSAKGR